MNKKIMALLMSIFLMFLMSPGCGDNQASSQKSIIIGYLTDLTGPASTGLVYLNWALQDQIKQINEDKTIAGTELKLEIYDTKYDASRALLGYDYLKGLGAKVIFNVEATSAEALKSKCERDKIPMFGLTCTTELTTPPGWVFLARCPANYVTAALAKYVGDSWKQVAKIRLGFLGWSTAENLAQIEGIKNYATTHPELFEIVATCIEPQGTMDWSADLSKLKECDYLFFAATGVAPAIFCQQYRSRGYTAKFLCTDGSMAFLALYIDKVGWPGMDGTLSIHSWGWWNLDTPLTNEAKELLQKYHPDRAEEAMAMGMAYIGGFSQWRVGLNILVDSIKAAEDGFDGTAFYEQAQTKELNWEGYEPMSFSTSKRYVPDYANVWKLSAADQDLIKVSDWLPIIEN